MADPSVLYEVKAGVGTITLNRPAVLNALHMPVAVELAEATERAAKDPEVWTVVVRGAGRAFSSGMDRTALARGSIGEAFYRHWIRALNCLEDMDKLVIGVLHGYCIGGGLQLAVACDVRLAAADAVLGLGATRHGLIPDGSILRLARLIGLGPRQGADPAQCPDRRPGGAGHGAGELGGAGGGAGRHGSPA